MERTKYLQEKYRLKRRFARYATIYRKTDYGINNNNRHNRDTWLFRLPLAGTEI